MYNENIDTGNDGKTWPATMDAKVWADVFYAKNTASDHTTMLGWFANAIMVGYDAAKADENNTQIDVEYEYKKAIEYLDALRVPSFAKDTGMIYSLRGRIELLLFMIEDTIRASKRNK